jgi:hypothetical protein
MEILVRRSCIKADIVSIVRGFNYAALQLNPPRMRKRISITRTSTCSRAGVGKKRVELYFWSPE